MVFCYSNRNFKTPKHAISLLALMLEISFLQCYGLNDCVLQNVVTEVILFREGTLRNKKSMNNPFVSTFNAFTKEASHCTGSSWSLISLCKRPQYSKDNFDREK